MVVMVMMMENSELSSHRAIESSSVWRLGSRPEIPGSDCTRFQRHRAPLLAICHRYQISKVICPHNGDLRSPQRPELKIESIPNNYRQFQTVATSETPVACTYRLFRACHRVNTSVTW